MSTNSFNSSGKFQVLQPVSSQKYLSQTNSNPLTQIISQNQTNQSKQFDQLLQRSLDLQDLIQVKQKLQGSSTISNSKPQIDLPKITRKARTFKEIAEVLLGQLNYLLNSPQTTEKEAFNLKSPQKQIESQFLTDRTNADEQNNGEIGQNAAPFLELLREKDQIIEILKQEKGYYQQNYESIVQLSPQKHDQEQKQSQSKLIDEIRSQIESECKDTIQRQQQIIDEQVTMLQQYDDKLILAQKDIDGLREKMGQLIKENEKLQNSQSLGAGDLQRQDAMQLQLIEQLVKDKNRLTLENLQLKEDNQDFRELKNSLSPQIGSPRQQQQIIKEIVPPHIHSMIKHIYSQTLGSQDSTIVETNIDEQLKKVLQYIETQSSKIIELIQDQQQLKDKLQLSTNMKSNNFNEYSYGQNLSNLNQTQLQSNQMETRTLKHIQDQRFSQYINVSALEQIYKEFFNQSVSSGHSSQSTSLANTQNQIGSNFGFNGLHSVGNFNQLHSVLEQKNRSFKDLYNLLEEATFKFYDLFVSSFALQQKNEKLEETFQQLDSVFSHAQESQDPNDRAVLDELRRLSNHILQQVFDLQKEVAMYKALDGAPIQLVKILKKSGDKHQKKYQSVSGILTLEEQVNELNSKLKEQDKQLRQKEKKLHKKSGIRKSSQLKEETFHDHNLTQNLLIFRQNEPSKLEYANLENQYNETCANLDKALTQIFKLEEQYSTTDKEKTLLILEVNKFKSDLERAQNEKNIIEMKYNEIRSQYDTLIGDKDIYESNLKQLNDQIQEIMNVIEEYQSKIQRLEAECDSNKERADKVSQLNEELRDLVHQERNAYNEEKLKSDDLIENIMKQNDSKIKIIKQKISNLLENELGDKFKQSDSLTFEELLTKIQEIIQSLREKASQQQVDMGFLNNTGIQTFANQFNRGRDISPVKAALDQSKFVGNRDDTVQAFNTATKKDEFSSKTDYRPSEFIYTENTLKQNSVQKTPIRNQEAPGSHFYNLDPNNIRSQQTNNRFDSAVKNEDNLRVTLRNPSNPRDYYMPTHTNEVRTTDYQDQIPKLRENQSQPRIMSSQNTQVSYQNTQAFNPNTQHMLTDKNDQVTQQNQNSLSKQSSQNKLQRLNALTPNRLHSMKSKHKNILSQANTYDLLLADQKEQQNIQNRLQYTQPTSNLIENRSQYQDTQSILGKYKQNEEKNNFTKTQSVFTLQQHNPIDKETNDNKLQHNNLNSNSKNSNFKINLIIQEPVLDLNQVPQLQQRDTTPVISQQNQIEQYLIGYQNFRDRCEDNNIRLREPSPLIPSNSTQEGSNKKSISDILTNFKKEKDHFNDKLQILKTKLEQVKSPEKLTTTQDIRNLYFNANNDKIQLQNRDIYQINAAASRFDSQNKEFINQQTDAQNKQVQQQQPVSGFQSYQNSILRNHNPNSQNQHHQVTQNIRYGMNSHENSSSAQSSLIQQNKNEGRNLYQRGGLYETPQIENRRAKTSEKIRYY
eukprot:403339503